MNGIPPRPGSSSQPQSYSRGSPVSFQQQDDRFRSSSQLRTTTRPSTPTSANTNQGVNLDAWNKGLLGSEQLDSVNRLSEWVKRRDPRRSTSHTESKNGHEENIKQPAEEEEEVSISKSNEPVSLPSAPLTSSSTLLPWLESVKSSSSSSSIIPLDSSSPSSDQSQTAPSLQHYTSSLSSIESSVSQITSLLDQLEQARVNVAELKAGAKSVEETSEELRDESERRGGSHEHLLELSKSLDLYLSYYSLLPRATTFLSNPSLGLVLTPTFNLTMSQLDVGLSFILKHPHFMDSSLYRLRFEHCLMRGGNLSKLWVTNRIKQLKGEATDRVKAKGKAKEESDGHANADLLNFGDADMLRSLYSGFAAAAPELQSVLIELQKRCPKEAVSDPSSSSADHKTKESPQDEQSLLADYSTPPNERSEAAESSEEEGQMNTFPEYATLLTDCRNAYFDARRSILSTLISTLLTNLENKAQAESTAQPKESANQYSPLHIFAERALVAVKSILISEGTLYQAIFGQLDSSSRSTTSSSRTALVDFLKSLSKPLFDRLHPRIFAESRVSSLSSIAQVILSAANTQQASVGSNARHPAVESDGYILFSLEDPHYPEARPYLIADALEHTICIVQPLISPLMDDVIMRVTFRARAIINGPDVAGFTPKSGSAIVQDDPLTLIKKVMGKAMSKDNRKSMRGRSSLGVGVLEAAAQRALEEHSAAKDAEKQPGKTDDDNNSTTIELFTLPSQEALATWYTPLIRIFKILSLLHPITSRSVFAQIGADSIDKMRGAIKRASEQVRGSVSKNDKKSNTEEYQPTGLDVSIFTLHQMLLLREISASTDLSLMQLSTVDKLQESIKSSFSQHPSASSTLDSETNILTVTTIIKIVSGLLEGIGLNSSSSATTAEEQQVSSPLDKDLQFLINDVVTLFLSTQLPSFTSSKEYIEETIIKIRQFKRHTLSVWLNDNQEISNGILTGIVAGIGKDHKTQDEEGLEDLQAEVLDRLGLV